MSENQDWNKLRSEITDSAKNILKNTDYENMVDNVKAAAYSAIDEVVASINQKYKKASQEKHPRKELERGIRREERQNLREKYRQSQLSELHLQDLLPKNLFSSRRFRPAKQISSFVVLSFFAPFGIAACILILVWLLVRVKIPVGGYIAAACVAMFSLSMVVSSIANLLNITQARRFMNILGERSYINLKELAEWSGKSIASVRKSLRTMINQGIFPQGHLDKEEQCFMIDNETYNKYLAIEVERASYRMTHPEAVKAENANETVKEDFESQYPEAANLNEEDRKQWLEVIKIGKEYTQSFNRLNESIKGETISEKLSKLEKLLQDIFSRVREKPDEISNMYKFMDYYLPTTLKLVQAYDEFERISQPGEDVLEAKREIEATLDTINLAFTELLNKLFKNAAYDAAADAQVLQTMLAKEGLTGGISDKTKL